MPTTKQIRRIFLSSPLLDLHEHRNAAKRAISKFQQVYEDFTEWSSDAGSPLEVSLKRVQACDLLVLILAHRYGTAVDEIGGKSITHAEVDAAIAAGIPIRAFFASEEYPWIVKDVDADSAKLDALKAQVSRVCTPAYFGSPESLEIELSRCFLEILIAEGLRPEAEMAALVRPFPLAELSSTVQGRFVIGQAADGLPLALWVTIDRSGLEEVEQAISSLISLCQISDSDKTLDTMQEAARKVATIKTRDKWDALPRAANGEFMARHFVVQDHLATRSMLISILDSCVKRVEARLTRVVEAQTVVLPVRVGEAAEPRNFFEEAPVGIGINASGVKRILALHRGEWRVRRDYITESIQAIKAAMFCIRFDPYRYGDSRLLEICEILSKQGGAVYLRGVEVGINGLRTNYSQTVQELRRERRGVHIMFESSSAYRASLGSTDLARYSHSTEEYDTYATFPVSSLIEIVIKVVEELVKNESVVHGNIKPGNILITDSGVRIVDGWNVKVGKSTPLFSDAWASPEQAMGEGIDGSTDVFGLCKVIAAILRLQISGELVTYRVSRWDGTEEHDFRFIRKPHIQYHQSLEVAEFPERGKLNELLRDGLAGLREDRIRSTAELLARLREINFDGLKGWRRMPIWPALQRHQLRLHDGRYSAFREIRETVMLGFQIERESRPEFDLDQTVILRR